MSNHSRAQQIREMFQPREGVIDTPRPKYTNSLYLDKTFELPTGRYDIQPNYHRADGSLYISFYRNGDIFAQTGRSPHEMRQGLHDLMVILNYISNLIHYLRTHERLVEVSFQGVPGRDDIYKRLADAIAHKYNGRVKRALGDMVTFVITFPE